MTYITGGKDLLTLQIIIGNNCDIDIIMCIKR